MTVDANMVPPDGTPVPGADRAASRRTTASRRAGSSRKAEPPAAESGAGPAPEAGRRRRAGRRNEADPVEAAARDTGVGPALLVWAAEQVHRQHVEPEVSYRATGRCAQCGEAGCEMLAWAESILAAETLPTSA